MHRVHSVGIVLLLIALETEAFDYCDGNNCMPNTTHVGCNNPGEFSSECDTPHVVDLESLIPMMLRMYNERRNTVAGGHTDRRPAVRMATMQWDEELAALALLNVKSCRLYRDQCHSTEKFKYSSQTNGCIRYLGPEDDFSDEHIVSRRIEKWMSRSNCSLDMSEECPDTQVYSVIPMLLAEGNTHVGCGAIRQKVDEYNQFIIACNYARTNVIINDIYEEGDEPASKCTTGINPLYPYLCSVEETYPIVEVFPQFRNMRINVIDIV